MTQADEILSRLTLREKVQLLAGRDWWHTEAIERLGIGSMHLSDGPVAVRGASWVGYTSICFPCGTAIGASFDPSAAALLARALADECREKGVDVLLGPTVNLQRHPLGGRHFECYSEDPVLTAVLATSYITALQERGVAATIKHFVANDTEFERHTISSEVDEATLRHVYLLPFEEAVREAAPFALMTSYNRINGTYAAEHTELVADTLRREWGFDGLVMSDWFGARSTAASARAGLDLEMPGPPTHYGAKLVASVEYGELGQEVVTARARAVLHLAERLGRLDLPTRRPAPETTRQERREIARQLARRSFVLLKNGAAEGAAPLLPLELRAGERLAVVGPNAEHTAIQGGGSAGVKPEEVVSVLAGLRQIYEPLGVEVGHAAGCRNTKGALALQGPFRVEYFSGGLAGALVTAEETPSQPLSWDGVPAAGLAPLDQSAIGIRCSASLTARLPGSHSLSLHQVGRGRLLLDGEEILEGSRERGEGFHGLASREVRATVDLEVGRSYEVTVEYESVAGLPVAGFFIGHEPPSLSDDELIDEAASLAREADAVVCVVGSSAEWETEGEDREDFDLPGRQNDLVRAVLAANQKTAVVLNTGSPVSLDWAGDARSILQAWFGGEMAGLALAEVISGADEPGGRLPHTMPVRIEDSPAFAYYPGSEGRAPYGERLLVGYRHYAARSVEPLFWFGHGLSYTTFDFEPAGVVETDDLIVLKAVATNTGERTGSAVLQAYASPARAGEGDPPFVFLGIGRHRLGPGESAEVAIDVPRRRLRRLGLEGVQLLRLGWSAEPHQLQQAGEISLEA